MLELTKEPNETPEEDFEEALDPRLRQQLLTRLTMGARGTVAGTVALLALIASGPDDARAAKAGLALVGCQSSANGPEVPGCDRLEGLDRPGAIAFSADGRSGYASYPDGLAVFDRDAQTGALTFTQCLDAAGNPPCNQSREIRGPASDIVVTPDGLSVYAVSAKGLRLLSFRRDPATGRLAFGSCEEYDPTDQGEPGCPVGPFYQLLQIEASPDGQTVYLLDLGCSDNTGDCFTGLTARARDAQTSLLSGSGGATSSFDWRFGPITAAGANLYAVNSGSRTGITAFRRTASGLRKSGCVTEQKRNGCRKSRKKAQPAAVAVSPNGRMLVTVRNGRLAVFARDSRGRLSFKHCLATSKGKRPGGCRPLGRVPKNGLSSLQQLEFSADGRSLYAAPLHRGTRLVRFKVKPHGGKIAFADCLSSDRSKGCARTPALQGLEEIATVGPFLYASTVGTEVSKVLRFRLGG